MPECLEQLGVRPAQALRINHDADVDRERALFDIEIQVDRDHPADFHPEELHRCADFQAAQGLVEAQSQVLGLAAGRGEGGLLVFEQLEHLVFASYLIIGVELRGTEGDAAHQQGRQRLGTYRKAIGADFDVDAAGVPETGVVGDKFVVGRVHEDFDVHALAVLGQLVSHHLTHWNLAVIHR
ncbi:hypothetical protein D3C84_826920 [compost metagenome]